MGQEVDYQNLKPFIQLLKLNLLEEKLAEGTIALDEQKALSQREKMMSLTAELG